MGRYSEWLFVEIERRIEDVPDARRAQIMEEVRAHIQAATDARVELGMAVEEAERESVDEFGLPSTFEASMRETVLEAGGKGWVYGTFAASIILSIALPIVFRYGPLAMPSLYIAWTVCGALLIWHSFRIGRVLYRGLPAIMLSCMIMFAAAAPFLYMNLYASGGRGYLLTFEADEIRQREAVRAPALEEALAKLEQGIRAFRKEVPDANLAPDLYRDGVWLIPGRQDGSQMLERVAFVPADLKAAAYEWRAIAPSLKSRVQMELEVARGNVAAIDNASKLTYLQSFRQLFTNSVLATALVGLFAFAFHAFSGIAGALYKWGRSRPKWPRARAYR